MLHDPREEAAAADEVEACAAPAGLDVAANAARTSAPEVTAHHSALLRLGAFLGPGSLIWTKLPTG
jgi:hypothetical protein